MNRKLLAVVLFIGLFLSACSSATPPAAEVAEQPTEAASAHTVHWTYDGEEGPDHWGEIDPSYAACGTGQSQSPVDLVDATAQDLTNIAFNYQPSQVNILNNGHTVQVNYDAGSYIEVDGQRYDVAQFHYHAPSEHAVNGQLFDAELHIVHKNADGQLAVIGILLEKGTANPAYDPFINNLPAHESEEEAKGVEIDAASLLPEVQTTFRYSGSLTTPPCTEGVSWFVMTTPVQLSEQQLAALETVFKGNNRPVQMLNARALNEDNTP